MADFTFVNGKLRAGNLNSHPRHKPAYRTQPTFHPQWSGNARAVLVREGGSHSVFRFGTQSVVIPRHREINELTARGILRSLGLK